jgi:hypothetical protein
MTVIQKQPTTYRSILPAVPRHFHSLSSPGGFARLSIPQPSFDHPFIYTVYVNRNPYQLLGVSDQFEASFIALLGDLYFPPNLTVYNPDSSSNQWASFAHFEGIRWEGCPNPYFTANGGLTTQDRADIHHGVKLGWRYHEIWAYVTPFTRNKWSTANHRSRRSFNERGMDWDTFRFYAPKAEAFEVGDPILEAKIWNDFQKGDWKKFDSTVPSEPVDSMDIDGGFGRTGKN